MGNLFSSLLFCSTYFRLNICGFKSTFFFRKLASRLVECGQCDPAAKELADVRVPGLEDLLIGSTTRRFRGGGRDMAVERGRDGDRAKQQGRRLLGQ